ncbi:MAG: eIF2A-related protein [Candidatus Sericytochromatia bacterium]
MRVHALSALLCLLMAGPAHALWEADLKTGEEGRLKSQERDIFSLAISGDRYLASGSFNGTTRIWDLRTGEVKHEFPGHANWVGAVAFNPAGTLLATAGLDGQVQIWDVESGENIKSLKAPQKGLLSVAFSPDGTQMATGGFDNEILIFDTATWALRKSLKGHSGGISSLAYSPDGNTLASCGFNDLGVRLWDSATGQLLSNLIDHTEEVYSVAYSPDGKYLASGGADKVIRIWSTQTLLPLARLAGHLKPVWTLAFTPDSQLLSSGSVGDQVIRFWSVPQGANVQTLTKVGEKTYSLVFMPDGKRLYSGHNDATIRIWHDVPESSEAIASKPLQISLGLQGWQTSDGPGDPRPGQQGELMLTLENGGTEHLRAVTAEVRIRTPGVTLNSPVSQFYIERFEAGSRKTLPLALTLPAHLRADALQFEIRIQVREPEGQTVLPLRVPLTQGATR